MVDYKKKYLKYKIKYLKLKQKGGTNQSLGESLRYLEGSNRNSDTRLFKPRSEEGESKPPWKEEAKVYESGMGLGELDPLEADPQGDNTDHIGLGHNIDHIGHPFKERIDTALNKKRDDRERELEIKHLEAPKAPKEPKEPKEPKAPKKHHQVSKAPKKHQKHQKASAKEQAALEAYGRGKRTKNRKDVGQ